MMRSTSTVCCSTFRARTRWLALPMLGALFAPATALAGNKEDAKAHIAKATRAHKEARYDDARAELETAYRLDPKPDLLYAIGQVDAKLGDCDEAIRYYRRFTATQSDPQVARIVDEAITACSPAPAAPGSATASAEPATERPGAAPRKPRVARRTSPAGTAPSVAVVASRPSPWYRDTVGGALVAGGAAATIVGLLEYRSALSDLDAAGDRASTTTLERYHELVDSAHGKRTASIVLVGAGGALITAGVVRYVVRSPALEHREVGISPARGGGVVTYRGRF
jgi:tetratricopeptide (TPR) repeat protein